MNIFITLWWHLNIQLQHKNMKIIEYNMMTVSSLLSIVINLVLDYKTIFVQLRRCVAVAEAVLHINSDQSSVGL